MIALLAACADPTTGSGTPSGTPTASPPPTTRPLPDDLDEIDFPAVFEAAARTLVTVTAQTPWAGHAATLEARAPGCPDLWTGPFTVAGVTVSRDGGVAWNDDCRTPDGLGFDGWLWWDAAVTESGDPTSYDGRITEASRTVDGDAAVVAHDARSGDEELAFEFDGLAADSLYRVRAAGGYERLVYNSQVDATVTGAALFGPDGLAPGGAPDGWRTDVVLSLTQGDVDHVEVRGDLYLFTEQLAGRFDSVGADLELQGARGAGPDSCTLEPLGWLGVRDADAVWYDVVFLPRFEEDLGDGATFPNDPLSECDGCGRLYVEGRTVPDPATGEPREICLDLGFLLGDAVSVPDTADYVLPWRPFDAAP